MLFRSSTLKDNNISPSFDEMRKFLGLSSKSGVHRLISSLEERGFIKRLHNKARAIKIIKEEDYTSSSLPETYSSTNGNSYKIFIYGSIAAGTPLEAIQNSEGHLNVPIDMIKNNNQHYALKVSGESMINAGILDGDIEIGRAHV